MNAIEVSRELQDLPDRLGQFGPVRLFFRQLLLAASAFKTSKSGVPCVFVTPYARTPIASYMRA
jgi:hypothetical protein